MKLVTSPLDASESEGSSLFLQFIASFSVRLLLLSIVSSGIFSPSQLISHARIPEHRFICILH